jgi:hypothetical protein
MQDEPGEGLGFSYKMSLKERSAKLGFDHQLTNRDAISLEQIRAFWEGSRFQGRNREEVYGWIRQMLRNQRYPELPRRAKV